MTLFCSLGFHCQASKILIRNNLKIESYPFDWMFSNINIIKDCIEDNFKKLLDQKYYIDYHNKFYNNNCGHSLYKNNLFPHRDMRVKHNHEYLKRCVDRFNCLCKSNKEKIFLITIIHSSLITNINDNLNNLKKLLGKKTTNFKIVCLFFLYSKNYNDHYIEINDNIHIIYIYSTSKSDGLKFEDERDNIYVDNILLTNYTKNKNVINHIK
jgi:hypothetical protein